MIKGKGSTKEEIEDATNSDLNNFFIVLNVKVSEIFNPDEFHF